VVLGSTRRFDARLLAAVRHLDKAAKLKAELDRRNSGLTMGVTPDRERKA